MKILEGGNVFKDADKKPTTTRINLKDVAPTIKWLEGVSGLPLTGNELGSTGKKPTSGDLDLAVDANKINKAQLRAKLEAWATSQGLDPREYVAASGISVHLKTPINGNSKNGFVQTDFMFMQKLDWSKWFLSHDQDTNYKGVHRNVLLSSIAKSMGYKINQNVGLVRRDNDQLISDNPDDVAKIFLGKFADKSKLGSVEKIIAALQQDPEKEAKLADFRGYAEREGISIEESVNEVTAIAKLRDRIVNQGMMALVEDVDYTDEVTVLLEADVRIPHLEDLVFDRGAEGIRQALDIVKKAAANTADTTTVKWDGKPAIIFGRKPDGTFVLTDKSGFLAKGYDGLATSPEMINRVMDMRKGDRTELKAMYGAFWKALENATPDNFRGYIKGDVLFDPGRPVANKNGQLVFKPNVIEYSIPADSNMGKQIANAGLGVAVHTFMADPESEEQALGSARPLQNVPGLFIGYPGIENVKNIEPNAEIVKRLERIIQERGNEIDQLLNPQILRQNKISNFALLWKQYINSLVNKGYRDLGRGFLPWVKTKATPSKLENVKNHIQDHKSAMASLLQAFLDLTVLKNELNDQLSRQVPGQEGFVIATDSGRAKLVSRVGGFSALNRMVNNPDRDGK